jgi:hypothetical protein
MPLLRGESNDGPVGDSRPCIGSRSCLGRQGSARGGCRCRTDAAVLLMGEATSRHDMLRVSPKRRAVS